MSGERSDPEAPRGWKSEPAAVYGLEHPVDCPVCRQEIDRLFVVRLYRAASDGPRPGVGVVARRDLLQHVAQRVRA